MKKIFRAIAYLFLIVVFFGSLGLFLFQDKALAYLNSIAQADSKSATDKALAKGNANDISINPDSVFKDQKFIKLKKAVVDSTGLNLPHPDNASTTPDGQPSEKLPDFKVGNDNPFKPF